MAEAALARLEGETTAKAENLRDLYRRVRESHVDPAREYGHRHRGRALAAVLA